MQYEIYKIAYKNYADGFFEYYITDVRLEERGIRGNYITLNCFNRGNLDWEIFGFWPKDDIGYFELVTDEKILERFKC